MEILLGKEIDECRLVEEDDNPFVENRDDGWVVLGKTKMQEHLWTLQGKYKHLMAFEVRRFGGERHRGWWRQVVRAPLLSRQIELVLEDDMHRRVGRTFS